MADTGRRLGTWLRVALDGLGRPPAVSAAYFTLLSALGLTLAYGDERVQGVSVHSLRALIESGYRDEVLRVSALAVGLSLILGALLGAFGWLSVRAREKLF